MVSQILRDSVCVCGTSVHPLKLYAWLWFFFLSFYRKKNLEEEVSNLPQSGGDYYPIKTCPHLFYSSSTFQGRGLQTCFSAVFSRTPLPKLVIHTHTKEEKRSGANRDWITTREVVESVTRFSTSRRIIPSPDEGTNATDVIFLPSLSPCSSTTRMTSDGGSRKLTLHPLLKKKTAAGVQYRAGAGTAAIFKEEDKKKIRTFFLLLLFGLVD